MNKDLTISDLAQKFAKDFALSIKERNDLLLKIDSNKHTSA